LKSTAWCSKQTFRPWLFQQCQKLTQTAFNPLQKDVFIIGLIQKDEKVVESNTCMKNQKYRKTLIIINLQQLQALGLQPAVWEISCLVLVPSSCNNSSVYSLFSNNCKATAVTHTKRINLNLLRKETSFVCYTSSILTFAQDKRSVKHETSFLMQ